MMVQYRTIKVLEVGRPDVHLNFGYNEALTPDLFQVSSAWKANLHLFLAYYSRPKLQRMVYEEVTNSSLLSFYHNYLVLHLTGSLCRSWVLYGDLILTRLNLDSFEKLILDLWVD